MATSISMANNMKEGIVMKCMKCGTEFENANFCPKCGAPASYQQANPNFGNFQQPIKPKNSKLSILALIFSLTGCLFFVGIILAIIDLATQKKTEKHTLSIIAIIIGVIWLIFAVNISTNSSDKSSSTPSTQATVQPDSPVQPDTTQPESEQTEQTESESQPEISEEDFKASCQDFDYKTIARNPDNYIGQNFKLTVQVMSTANGGFFDDYDQYYKTYTADEYGNYFNDLVYVMDKQDTTSSSYLKILDKDIITV